RTYGESDMNKVLCSIGLMIISLFLGCRPSAVPRFVVPIVVDPVDAQILWPWPHVSQEVLKFLPSFTHSNSSTSVALPLLSFRVFTSEAHGVPDSIFGGLASMLGAPMFKWGLTSGTPLFSQAT